MPIATRNCDHCGREYSRRRQSEIGRFCSVTCSAASRRQATTSSCQQCGQEFARQGSSTRRHCSRACAANSLRRQAKHTCDHCGVEFSRVPTQSGKHCSKACAYAARRKEEPGHRRMLTIPGHPLTSASPYIPEYRVILFDQIGPGAHPCHYCRELVTWNPGGGTSQRSLVVDHLDRNPMNNSIENLVPSCTRCNVLNADRTVTDDETFRVLPAGTRLRGESRACECCGKPFVTWTKNPGPGRGRFCSRSCARRKPKSA